MNKHRQFIDKCFNQMMPPGAGNQAMRDMIWHAHTAGMATVIEFLEKSQGIDDVRGFAAEVGKIMIEEMDK